MPFISKCPHQNHRIWVEHTLILFAGRLSASHVLLQIIISRHAVVHKASAKFRKHTIPDEDEILRDERMARRRVEKRWIVEENREELAERARAGTRRGWIKGVIFAGTQAVIINETDGGGVVLRRTPDSAADFLVFGNTMWSFPAPSPLKTHVYKDSFFISRVRWNNIPPRLLHRAHLRGGVAVSYSYSRRRSYFREIFLTPWLDGFTVIVCFSNCHHYERTFVM